MSGKKTAPAKTFTQKRERRGARKICGRRAVIIFIVRTKCRLLCCTENRLNACLADIIQLIQRVPLERFFRKAAPFPRFIPAKIIIPLFANGADICKRTAFNIKFSHKAIAERSPAASHKAKHISDMRFAAIKLQLLKNGFLLIGKQGIRFFKLRSVIYAQLSLTGIYRLFDITEVPSVRRKSKTFVLRAKPCDRYLFYQ